MNTSSLMMALFSVTAAGCLGDLQDDPIDEDTSTVEQLISCSGNGCNGLDPSLTPCAAGAVTPANGTRTIYRNGTTLVIGKVELRWSAACGTNWARVTRSDGGYPENMFAKVTRSDGVNYWESLNGFQTIWSPMVYAPVACASAYGVVDQSWTSGSATTPCL